MKTHLFLAMSICTSLFLTACGGGGSSESNEDPTDIAPLEDQPTNSVDVVQIQNSAIHFQSQLEAGQRVPVWYCSNQQDTIQYTIHIYTDGTGFYRENLKGTLQLLFSGDFTWESTAADAMAFSFADSADDFVLSNIRFTATRDGDYSGFLADSSSEGRIVCNKGDLFI